MNNGLLKKLNFKLMSARINEFLKVLHHLRKNNSDKIKKLLRKNQDKSKEALSKKRIASIKKIVKFYGETSDSILKTKLLLWRKKLMGIVLKNSALNLVKFSCKILSFKKRKAIKFIKNTTNFYEKMLKKRAFYLIYMRSQASGIKNKLKKRINDYSQNRNVIKLQKSFNIWKNNANEIINNAANKVTSTLRCKRAKKKKKDLKINKKIAEFLEKKYQKAKELLRKYFDKFKSMSGQDAIGKVRIIT